MHGLNLSADVVPVPRAESRSSGEEIWLLGQPALGDYLDYVRKMTIDGALADKRALVDEWRAAKHYYYELEESEKNIADEIECRDLPAELALLVEEVKASPGFRRTYDTLPTTFAVVELDRLILFQKHVAAHFVKDLMSRLGPKPTPEAVFRFCF